MKIQLRCPACRGAGLLGDRGERPRCGSCGGASYIAKAPEELTREERAEALAALVSRETPEAAYDRQDSQDHVARMLTGLRIHAVSFTADHPPHILLTGPRGVTLRIQPELRAGVCHHLSITAEPPHDPHPSPDLEKP